MSDEWVMVPRKLAESQRNAMAMTHRHDYGIREEWERENIRKHMDQLHRAMLDAAPKPPVPETNFGNMLDCDIEPRPLDFPLRDYHHAIGEGPLHYTWTDKPHRLVYDLIAAVRYYAAPKPQEQSEPVEIVPPAWRGALRKLTFMARTSGGTLGPDEGLQTACAEAEALLSKPYNYPPAAEVQLQGGLDNEELLEAWRTKVPGVEPTDSDLRAFALGVEFGTRGKRAYFDERNSARDAWRRRVKQCETLEAEVQRLRDALKPFAAIDLTTNQAVDGMSVLRARIALEGGE